MARRAEIEDAQAKELADPQVAEWAWRVVVSWGCWRTHYLHDLVGPALFRSVHPRSSSMAKTIVEEAQMIYGDRAFDRLPILADALADAGYEDVELLAHLRGSGPHVRGCWALDLVLGKE